MGAIGRWCSVHTDQKVSYCCSDCAVNIASIFWPIDFSKDSWLHRILPIIIFLGKLQCLHSCIVLSASTLTPWNTSCHGVINSDAKNVPAVNNMKYLSLFDVVPAGYICLSLCCFCTVS